MPTKTVTTILLCFFAVGGPLTTCAKVYQGNPLNYLTFIDELQPGDTLQLSDGIYTDRLRLIDVQGTADKPIVITGPEAPATAVFQGNACCNTVSLTRCAHLVIEKLIIDGQDIPYIDAVKAEGTMNNWTHHITLQHLRIVRHGAERLTTGINTKCPSWDWIIRFNEILEAGTGLYLGAPDGTAPFVNGRIEYNLIRNPLGYGCQVKHQNEGQRLVPGMTQEGKTVIRYNVIAKEANNDDANPRPNLLVGNFPATGPGSSDYYEIYGNLLWQNPKEGLFQGTGNLAFYNNVLVNHSTDGWGVFIFPHNNFQPRNIYLFQNTIHSRTEGIDLNNSNPNYEQIVAGNAVFSNAPIDADADVFLNYTSQFDEAASNLTNPSADIAQALYTPLPQAIFGDPLDPAPFSLFERYDWDFDGHPHNWIRRGAYVKPGPGEWKLALEIRAEVEEFPTQVDPVIKTANWSARLFGSPGTPDQVRLDINAQVNTELQWVVLNSAGRFVTAMGVLNCPAGQDLQLYPLEEMDLPPGTYYIVLSSSDTRDVKPAILMK